MPPSTAPDMHIKKDLFKLIVARADVERMRKAVVLMLKCDESTKPDLYRALSDAAVIAYGRPFSHNSPYGPLPNRYGRFNDEELRSSHKETLRFRDAVVAHSEASHQDVFLELVSGKVKSVYHSGRGRHPNI